jgi:endonuclease YncB( thermonuclease family)
MKTPTATDLKKKKIPYILIPGILAAIALGWKFDIVGKAIDFHEMRTLFPASGVVRVVEDGDTFVLQNSLIIRLVGINAPDRGEKKYSEALEVLSDLILDKKVYLEYDRYQDDKFARSLAWVWVGCEETPKFLPAKYMHKSNNESMPGLTENPEGCKQGKLINEEMIKADFAEPMFYKDRGELKYQKRIQSLYP